MRKLRIIALLMLSFALSFATAQDITIASKIDTEGSLLGQMMVVALENQGFEVEDRTSFGTTSVVREALLAGEIDMYPEYTGNIVFMLSEYGFPDDLATQPEQLYGVARVLDLNENNIVWLQPAPANNTWAIAIRESFAQEHDIGSLRDFADYINNGGEIVLVGSQEFVDRDDALGAFESTYGFELNDDQLVILAGGNTTQTLAATAQGTNGVNAGMSYGTDGALTALGLIALNDTEGAVAVYQPAPVLRGETFALYPEIADILEPIFLSLDAATLTELNGRVQVDGESAREVAEDYLQSKGFLN